MRREIPTAGGRKVLVRVCFEGEGVQLAIRGKRGGLVEAVSFDSSQLPALIAALEEAGRKAERELSEALSEAQRRAEARYQAALAANPWLNGGAA